MSLRERIDPAAIELSHEEVKRYSRHLIMPEVGMAGQKKICSTSVLCIGAGGLGSPITMYLAAAGVDRLGYLGGRALLGALEQQVLEEVGRARQRVGLVAATHGHVAADGHRPHRGHRLGDHPDARGQVGGADGIAHRPPLAVVRLGDDVMDE